MHLDTTHRKEQELALWRGANFDSLTNLPNRSLILDRIRQAVHRAKRHGEQLGLLFLDLDHFKQINDKLGHAAGDEVLRVFARRIETCVRAGDSVGRLAGDEFLIVLPGMRQVEDAKRVAGKILDATSHPIDLSGQSIVVTCSIGIAIFPEHGETAEDLIKRSDVALYAAKASGRDDVSVFSDLEGAPSSP
jgi:diguanylate cyclase (GGDEF)-like protein